MAEGGDVAGGCSFAEHLLDGVSGNQVDEQKDDRYNQPDDRESIGEADEEGAEAGAFHSDKNIASVAEGLGIEEQEEGCSHSTPESP
jgi:hypothetical protein